MSALRVHIIRWSIGRDSDMKEMGVNLANQWDLTVGRLEALTANDPEAERTICAASELLQTLTTTFGPIHSWTLSQHHLIFRMANRVFGENQRIVSKPNWTEKF